MSRSDGERVATGWLVTPDWDTQMLDQLLVFLEIPKPAHWGNVVMDIVDGIEFDSSAMYIGTRCKKAGHTVRYMSNGHCIACHREHDRHRYDDETPDEREARMKVDRAWRVRTKVERAVKNKDYYEKNKEEISRANKACYEKNKRARLSAQKVYRNSEKGREALARARHKRRAVKCGATTIERVDRETVFETDGWVCGICGKPVDKSLSWPDAMSVAMDHVIPLSRGGSHSYENVQCSHVSCNSRKGAKLDYIDARLDIVMETSYNSRIRTET